jgi:hypothetical protein
MHISSHIQRISEEIPHAIRDFLTSYPKYGYAQSAVVSTAQNGQKVGLVLPSLKRMNGERNRGSQLQEFAMTEEDQLEDGEVVETHCEGKTASCSQIDPQCDGALVPASACTLCGEAGIGTCQHVIDADILRALGASQGDTGATAHVEQGDPDDLDSGLAEQLKRVHAVRMEQGSAAVLDSDHPPLPDEPPPDDDELVSAIDTCTAAAVAGVSAGKGISDVGSLQNASAHPPLPEEDKIEDDQVRSSSMQPLCLLLVLLLGLNG